MNRNLHINLFITCVYSEYVFQLTLEEEKRTEQNTIGSLEKLFTIKDNSKLDTERINENSGSSDDDAEWFQGFESRLKVKISAEMARRLSPERKAIERKLL